jgi:hypothetical protein
MHVYDEKDLEGMRMHPWSTSEGDPRCRYYDFRTRPELIPTVLEDFLPWAHYAAVKDFYDYLAWLNGNDSELESNDCAFGGIRRNGSLHMNSKKSQADGRLMVFFRSLRMNCNKQNESYLKECFRFYLERSQPINFAAIGLSRLPTKFKAVNMIGSCLVFSFFAWGDTELETMATLQQLFSCLKDTSVRVCQDFREKVEILTRASAHS